MTDNKQFVDCVRIDGSHIRIEWTGYNLTSCGCGFGGGINYFEHARNGSVIERHHSVINGEFKETEVIYKTKEEVDFENQ